MAAIRVQIEFRTVAIGERFQFTLDCWRARLVFAAKGYDGWRVGGWPLNPQIVATVNGTVQQMEFGGFDVPGLGLVNLNAQIAIENDGTGVVDLPVTIIREYWDPALPDLQRPATARPQNAPTNVRRNRAR